MRNGIVHAVCNVDSDIVAFETYAPSTAPNNETEQTIDNRELPLSH